MFVTRLDAMTCVSTIDQGWLILNVETNASWQFKDNRSETRLTICYGITNNNEKVKF